MKKRILIVVGTRPNFVKITQFKKIAKQFTDLEVKIAHTGQHFDEKMSDIFLTQFNLEVDFFLNIENASTNNLIAAILLKLAAIIDDYKPHLLLCVGDVNSTLAAAICANKLGIPLGHIESGLRSFDRQMPEEINRILTDEISDICFVTENSGIENLKKIGKNDHQIAFVGNTMIDTLVHFETEIEQSTILEELEITKKQYILTTIHRPSNVDSEEGLQKIIALFQQLSIENTIVFPIHPRTKNNFLKFNLFDNLMEIKNLKISKPQNYFSFQKLIKHSFCVITDSGGIQEETTFQKIPCITLRENTERPSTITQGTNHLMSFDVSKINQLIFQFKNGEIKKSSIPEFWDGNATERILQKCQQFLS
jgi:UDP-N-acetylglucosamine 2-epimerase (non-hydrolysing)